jgi:hypothetical protein
MTDRVYSMHIEHGSGKAYFNDYGLIARVLHREMRKGILGTEYPADLVRFVGAEGDRWVVRLKERWLLLDGGGFDD